MSRGFSKSIYQFVEQKTLQHWLTFQNIENYNMVVIRSKRMYINSFSEMG